MGQLLFQGLQEEEGSSQGTTGKGNLGMEIRRGKGTNDNVVKYVFFDWMQLNM